MLKEESNVEVAKLEIELNRVKGDLLQAYARNTEMLRVIIGLRLRLRDGLDLRTPLSEDQKLLIEGKFARVLRRRQVEQPNWYGRPEVAGVVNGQQDVINEDTGVTEEPEQVGGSQSDTDS